MLYNPYCRLTDLSCCAQNLAFLPRKVLLHGKPFSPEQTETVWVREGPFPHTLTNTVHCYISFSRFVFGLLERLNIYLYALLLLMFCEHAFKVFFCSFFNWVVYSLIRSSLSNKDICVSLSFFIIFKITNVFYS